MHFLTSLVENMNGQLRIGGSFDRLYLDPLALSKFINVAILGESIHQLIPNIIEETSQNTFHLLRQDC